MALTNIEVIRQDTFSFAIYFKDSNGNPIDITGYQVWFTVRTAIPATSIVTDTDATISKTYTDGGATGVIQVDLSSDDTDIDVGKYFYDIQYKKTDDSIHSSGVYSFNVKADVTRGT